MSRLRSTAVALVLGAFAGAAALVFFHAARPAIVLDMDAELSELARGFHQPERAPDGVTFAWTGARAGLHLPGLDRRSPWNVSVRLRGARANPADLPEVHLAFDDAIVATTRTSNAFETLTAGIPASAENDRGVVISLIVSGTFVPGAGDPRTLGVMVDEIRVSPAGGAVALPPRRAIGAAMLSAAAYGGVLAAIGLTTIFAVGSAVLVALGHALIVSRGLGPYESYGGDLAWFGVAVALLMWAGVSIAERASRRPLRNTARFVAAFTAATLYLKLAALLHPAMPLGDALFEAHRFEWVLAGRTHFTSPGPGGLAWPHAIGLYVLAAPFTMLVHGLPAYVDLLRAVSAVADALAGLLAYLVIVRATGDRLAGAIACGLYHLVPVNAAVQTAGTPSLAFAQAGMFVTLALVALGTVRQGSRRGLVAGAMAASLAMLAHTAVAAVLAPALIVAAVLFARAGGAVVRAAAAPVAVMAGCAVAVATALFHGHFLDAWREIAVRAWDASGLPGRLAALPGEAIGGYGWPAIALAAAGTTWLVRRQQRDRLALVLFAWAGTCVAWLAVGLVTIIDVRPLLALFPAVAIAGGLGGSWGWRHSPTARAATGAALAWVVAQGVWAWLRPGG